MHLLSFHNQYAIIPNRLGRSGVLSTDVLV